MGVAHLCEISVGQLKKIPEAPFLGRDMEVTGDLESASDAKHLALTRRRICLGK